MINRMISLIVGNPTKRDSAWKLALNALVVARHNELSRSEMEAALEESYSTEDPLEMTALSEVVLATYLLCAHRTTPENLMVAALERVKSKSEQTSAGRSDYSWCDAHVVPATDQGTFVEIYLGCLVLHGGKWGTVVQIRGTEELGVHELSILGHDPYSAGRIKTVLSTDIQDVMRGNYHRYHTLIARSDPE